MKGNKRGLNELKAEIDKNRMQILWSQSSHATFILHARIMQLLLSFLCAA
jgi:hypothetical protein